MRSRTEDLHTTAPKQIRFIKYRLCLHATFFLSVLSILAVVCLFAPAGLTKVTPPSHPSTTTRATAIQSANAVYYMAFNEGLVRRFVFNGTSWTQETIGTVGAPPNFAARTLEIGDARNDGIRRLYVATDQIYEFTFNGSAWVKQVVLNVQAHAIDIGDGDNDGAKEIYTGVGNQVFMVKWSGGAWVSTLVGEAGGFTNVCHPIVGDVEGHDGLNEVYASGYDPDIQNKGFVQFKWNGSGWTRTVLGGAEQPYYGVDIGDGDNDGQNEVYQMNANFPVFQWDWSPAGWSKTGINSYFLPTYPEVADADNNGSREVYVVRDPVNSTANAFQIWRHSWNGSAWVGEQIPAPPTRRKAVGDGDNDGLNEIYAGESTLYKISWNGSTWVNTPIGTGTSTFNQFIIVGAVDNAASPTPTPTPTLFSIEVLPANPTIGVGQTQQFTAVGTYSDGSTHTLPAAIGPTEQVITEINGITCNHFCELALTPDGQTLYVTGGDGSNLLTVIDVPSRTIIKTITLSGSNWARAIAITPPNSPNPKRAYIGRFDGPIDIMDLEPSSPTFRTVVKSITDWGQTFGQPSGGRPDMIAFTPNGAKAYVSNESAPNPATSINAATETTQTKINFSSIGFSQVVSGGLVMSPDGSKVYVSHSSNGIGVVNTATDASIRNIDLSAFVGFSSNRITITPDGTRAYVADWGSRVIVVDLVNNVAVKTIPITGNGHWIAITPDGKRVYVAAGNTGASPQIIDTDPQSPTFETVVKTIPAAAGYTGIVFSPDGREAYLVNFGKITIIRTHIQLPDSVVWSSSTPSVATINGSGLATGVSLGTTTITATSGNISGSTTLTVSPPQPCPTNVAASSYGATATASSMASANYPGSGAIDGNRSGSNWGAGTGWNDATAGVYPDNLVVNLGATQSINEIDIYSLQDNYTSPVEPTESLTFTQYGLTDFQVQVPDGVGGWMDVPGGHVTGNNKVRKRIIFASPISTNQIRVLVNNSADGVYSRIVEVEAFSCNAVPVPTPTPTPTPTPCTTNVAAAAYGATASASSTVNANYPPNGVIDGNHTGAGWGTGVGWNDATVGVYPDNVTINLGVSQQISEILVYSLQDNYTSSVEPGDTTTFTYYGLTDFQVQIPDGSGGWIDVPGGHIVGNNLVKRRIALASPLTTNQIRILVNNSADGVYSRVVEVEVYSCNPLPVPTPTPCTTNVAASSHGATASASSTVSPNYPASGTIDGNRTGAGWGTGVGWNDGTPVVYPDSLIINLNATRQLSEIDIYSLQDNYTSPVEPTDTMTFTQYGLVNFQVQIPDGVGGWVNVPGGNITGNNLVKRKIVFASPVVTDQIRVLVNSSADGVYSRIVEVEAFSCSP